MKVVGVLVNPKDISNKSNSPSGFLKAIFYSSSIDGILSSKVNLDNHFDLDIWSNISASLAMENRHLTVILLIALLSL